MCYKQRILHECSYITEFIKRVGEKDKMRGYSIYHMMLNHILLVIFALKCHDFAIRKPNLFMDVNA